SGDLDDVATTNDEIAYLLKETKRLLPALDTSRDRVLFTYSGVRPLPYVDASSPGGITRRHFLIDHSPARQELYSVIGGKLTTHRSLAEDVVDTIAHELGNRQPCRTRDL